MNTKTGLMTVKSTGAEMKAIFIDREALEFAKMNMRTKNRINVRRNKKASKMRHRKNMKRIANRILIEVLFGGAVALAGTAGLIHPVIWTPAAIICLCSACVRLGMWFCMVVKK